MWFNGRSSEDVAIKIMKNNDEQERLKLLQEAAIMGQFAHKNVVRLHGVVTMGEPVSGGWPEEREEEGERGNYLQYLIRNYFMIDIVAE